MFVRGKRTKGYEYLQIVHNARIDGRVRQRTIATLGRLDLLQTTGVVDALAAGLAKHSLHTAVLTALEQGEMPPAEAKRFGPVLIFERLWQQLQIPQILSGMLADRHFEFAVERVLFVTVLHRLFSPGSDRAAEHWCRRYAITGIEDLQLHHFYRAMAWLGEELPDSEQPLATPFAPRCVKDQIEERLFESRRSLFDNLNVVFLDTTSIYFEGARGEQIGQRGNSKDHRPDLKQMVVGVVLDNHGRPICCEVWPGNTTDVKTLEPITKRLKQCFGIQTVCVVGDRGTISKNTIEKRENGELDFRYILGARMRRSEEVRDEVLSRAGRYREVYPEREKSKDPSPLKVKEVWIEDRRYIVCHNEEQARKDRADRDAIISSLRDQLKQGDKSLVGNKGYRRYLKTARGGAFSIDEDKLAEEARYDALWPPNFEAKSQFHCRKRVRAVSVSVEMVIPGNTASSPVHGS